jgi:hypothetical protein
MDARRTEILETRRYYSGLGLWPAIPGGINPEGWLSNFRADFDQQIAIELLDSFVHFSSGQTKRLITSAFHALSYQVERMRGVPPYSGSGWREYLANVQVSYPQEDERDPAGSGRIFLRQARANLLPSEEQLHDPDDLLTKLAHSSVPSDIILIDDFAGSGDQFLKAMRREVQINATEATSYAELINERKLGTCYYLPAVATSQAIERIQGEIPFIEVRPAHVLPDRYSASHAKTLLVPDQLRDGLDGFLRRHARKAGYSEAGRYGHRGSGLAISFDHGVPDNTLPLFTADASGWVPLRKRLQE